MTDDSDETSVPNGSTDRTDAQRDRTDDLPDGSVSGNATEDPDQDSDANSGGEPDAPAGKSS
jgi:hypothetical protein